ncbi:hypothetical protein [Streptomyces sp. NPDC056883]|uniref:hypothetical protein n=1 Tax=Streptomyces sp. NPDC056883 TaxID=3345959 RepID=UPI00369128EE
MENQVQGLADFATLVGLMSRPPADEHAASDTAAFVNSLTHEQAVAMAVGGTDVLAGLFHAFALHAREHDMTGGALLIQAMEASAAPADPVLTDEVREDLTALARSLALRTAVIGHG